MAEGMAFNQMTPPLSVTDPVGQGRQEWPRHLHKAGVSADGGPRYVVVQDAAEEAAALADGWKISRAEALAAPADAPDPPPAPTRKR
jgi:hypothetical protein